MTNYEKIKKLIDAGFMVKAYDKKEIKYCIYSSIMADGDIRRSYWKDNYKNCFDCLGTVNSMEEDINSYDLELTPIPNHYKEIKGKVDIIDCPEIIEIAKRDGWYKDKIEMIGQKGLEIEKYFNDGYGQCYRIWNNDKPGCDVFPAWAVAPNLEEDDEDILIKNGKKYKVKIIKEII